MKKRRGQGNRTDPQPKKKKNLECSSREASFFWCCCTLGPLLPSLLLLLLFLFYPLLRSKSATPFHPGRRVRLSLPFSTTILFSKARCLESPLSRERNNGEVGEEMKVEEGELGQCYSRQKRWGSGQGWEGGEAAKVGEMERYSTRRQHNDREYASCCLPSFLSTSILLLLLPFSLPLPCRMFGA